MRKNTGEEGTVHGKSWKSVEGSLKLQLNTDLCTIGLKHHMVTERMYRKQKEEQFLELAQGWGWFRFPPVQVGRACSAWHVAKTLGKDATLVQDQRLPGTLLTELKHKL